MAFEVGAIIGDLELRTQKFDAGIEHGEEKAGESGGKLTEIFGQLGESISGEAGEAVSGLGELIEGLGGGPVAAVMAVVAAFAAMYEVTTGVAAHIEDVSLAATKAGTSVGFMSDLAEQASTVNVSMEQLSSGFRMLETTAGEAAQGNKAAEESFNRIGISAIQLTELMKNPEELFKTVQTAIGGMTDASERMAASRGLLGRGGADLIPLMAQTAEQTAHLHSVFEETGAGVTDQDAAMGASFKEMTSVLSSAWEGVEKALATPVLQYVQDNLPEIEEAIIDTADVLKGVIEVVWNIGEAIYDVGKAAVFVLEHTPIPMLVEWMKDLLGTTNDVVDATAKIGMGGAGSSAGGGGGRGNTYNVTVTHDASESGKQFGDRVIQAVRSGVAQQQQDFQASARQQLVQDNMAGSW